MWMWRCDYRTHVLTISYIDLVIIPGMVSYRFMISYSSLLITVDTQHTGLLILKDLNYGYYYTSYMAAVVCNRLLKIMSSTKLLTVPGYQGRVQKNKEC